MKLEIDCQFAIGEKGCIHLRPMPKYAELAKNYMKQQKVNKVVRCKLSEKEESKSVKQNRTFHLLWDIYWKSGEASDETKTKMRNRLKYEHGITEFFETSDGKVIAALKSISEYTLRQGRDLIQGTIDEMLMNGVNDKRFQEMIQDFNSWKDTK